jgi:hypothetical protein
MPFPIKIDFTMFPNDEREITVAGSTSTGELEREMLPRFPQSTRAFIQPYFAGCVKYRFSFSGEWHCTFVNFKVAHAPKTPPTDPGEIGGFAVGQNYPADEIWLVPSFQGGNDVT